jgi:hypothetical protein
MSGPGTGLPSMDVRAPAAQGRPGAKFCIGTRLTIPAGSGMGFPGRTMRIHQLR